MSDRLSPILVKELRQGLRARVFEGSFLLLQALMVFAMITALSAAAAEKQDLSKTFGEVFFWAMVSIPLLLIMPMRGTASLRPEIDSKSLELIFLTRLSARRIVTGKWAALFCQTCLLVCAILPYAVLRYYLGSVNVARDLAIIVGLLGASALLTAMTVSVSAFPSKLARGMVFVFPILLLNIGPFAVASVGFYSGYGSSSLGPVSSSAGVWGGFLVTLAYCVLITAYVLEIGAARIAPPAENHAIAKRVLGLVLIALGPIAIAFGADEAILLFNLAVLTPVCIDALCAPSRFVPGIYLPFLRRRWGRLVGPFLLPGWPSGVLYTGVVFSLCAGMLLAWGQFADPDVSLVVLSLAAALLMPVALILLIRPHTQRFGTVYFAIQLGLIILTGLFVMLNEAFNWRADDILALVPVSTLLATMVNESDTSWLVPNGIVFALSLAVIAVRTVEAHRALGPTYAAAVALHRSSHSR